MKRTKKYSLALETLKNFPHSNQEELYSELNRLGFYWDSKKLQWVRDETAADPATPLIRVRIWAATDEVRFHAEIFKNYALRAGYTIVDETEPYACRPPKQLESRIYLTFLPEER
jgi:hypothetical protein